LKVKRNFIGKIGTLILGLIFFLVYAIASMILGISEKQVIRDEPIKPYFIKKRFV